jgi:hypothetical protein
MEVSMSLEEYNKNIEALKANTTSTITTKGKAGRPKGSHSKITVGLSLNRRLRILNKIATDKTADVKDVLAAVSLITQLLGDKVKEATDGRKEVVLSLDNSKTELKNNVASVEINKEPIINAVEPPASKTLEIVNAPAKDIKDVEQQVDVNKVGELEDFSEFSNNTGAEHSSFDFSIEKDAQLD